MQSLLLSQALQLIPSPPQLSLSERRVATTLVDGIIIRWWSRKLPRSWSRFSLRKEGMWSQLLSSLWYMLEPSLGWNAYFRDESDSLAGRSSTINPTTHRWRGQSHDWAELEGDYTAIKGIGRLTEESVLLGIRGVSFNIGSLQGSNVCAYKVAVIRGNCLDLNTLLWFVTACDIGQEKDEPSNPECPPLHLFSIIVPPMTDRGSDSSNASFKMKIRSLQ